MKPVNRIIAFGDSFIFGDELEESPQRKFTHNGRIYVNKHNAVGHLAALCHAPLENFALPGNSLQGIFWTFMHFMQTRRYTLHKDDLIVVGLTGPERHAFWDAEALAGAPYYSSREAPALRFTNDTNYRYPGNEHLPFHNMTKDHIMHSASPQLSEMNAYAIPHSIYGYCKAFNIRLFMTTPCTPYPAIEGYMDDMLSQPTNEWLTTHPNRAPSWFMPGGHWSPEGSHVVALHWLDQIKRYSI